MQRLYWGKDTYLCLQHFSFHPEKELLRLCHVVSLVIRLIYLALHIPLEIFGTVHCTQHKQFAHIHQYMTMVYVSWITMNITYCSGVF